MWVTLLNTPDTLGQLFVCVLKHSLYIPPRWHPQTLIAVPAKFSTQNRISSIFFSEPIMARRKRSIWDKHTHTTIVRRFFCGLNTDAVHNIIIIIIKSSGEKKMSHAFISHNVGPHRDFFVQDSFSSAFFFFNIKSRRSEKKKGRHSTRAYKYVCSHYLQNKCARGPAENFGGRIE